MVSVKYSWIPSKCVRCGQLGHKESRCLIPEQQPLVAPASIVVNDVVKEVVAKTAEIAHAPTVTHDSIVEVAFTPTIVVDVPAVATHTSASLQTQLRNYCNYSHCGLPTALVTPCTPMIDSLIDEDERNAFCDNFVTLDSMYSGFGMGDSSHRSRGGRPIKPTQKFQEMQWSLVKGRRNNDRGGRPRITNLGVFRDSSQNPPPLCRDFGHCGRGKRPQSSLLANFQVS
ncbi:unnamed protein product [Arabis nemorensis]|uniref:CCHC-type domain-containing protein n=1 Tax=Arabis nemorensis TaxID=586526 RepID=A0A565BXL3_9BRAS|nr:unnamed protein product [Arabis nemorensis]